MTIPLYDQDYILAEEGAWVEVKDFAIRILSTKQGLTIDVYRNGRELEDPIESIVLFDINKEKDSCK